MATVFRQILIIPAVILGGLSGFFVSLFVLGQLEIIMVESHLDVKGIAAFLAIRLLAGLLGVGIIVGGIVKFIVGNKYVRKDDDGIANSGWFSKDILWAFVITFGLGMLFFLQVG